MFGQKLIKLDLNVKLIFTVPKKKLIAYLNIFSLLIINFLIFFYSKIKFFITSVVNIVLCSHGLDFLYCIKTKC